MRSFVLALRATLAALVLTGIAYPLAVTGIAQVVFPARAAEPLAVDLVLDYLLDYLLDPLLGRPARPAVP